MRRVDPKVYTKEYYLSDCTGHEEFKKSSGDKLGVIFNEYIKHLEFRKKMNVLDVGCGRGELVFYSASKGAMSVGIDYSLASIRLAKEAQDKKNKDIQDKTKFIKMDAKKLKFPDSYFDLVIMTGVVEHLYPEEMEIALGEIKRVLKPNGKLFINTAPNKIFNDICYFFYTYPVSTIITFIWNFFTRSKYPNISKPDKLRKHSHSIMHINEPTYFYLLNLFRKFKLEGNIFSTNITVIKRFQSLKDVIFNLLVFLHPISKYFPLNVLFGSDFTAVLINKK